ncbi:MAG TPA: NAD(P)H-binding protein [Nitrososphaerales archaeon]|nr:NAD(P)H-binding protein [Nitrososphaerales archaeon]
MRQESGASATAKRYTVFGGTGLTGRKIVESALNHGDLITVLVRDKSKLGSLANMVSIVEGSATDPDAVEKAIPHRSEWP